jgi:hypothetical protein
MTWRKARMAFGRDAPISIVDNAHKNGFRILVTVRGDGQQAFEADYQDGFIAYLEALAQAGADAIEVWDEANVYGEMSMAETNPAKYATMLCSAYAAIKKANPGTLVVSGAPAPTNYYQGCSATGCDDLAWLQGLAEAGAAHCLDYLGAHFVQGATSPTESVGHPIDDHYTRHFGPLVEAYTGAFGDDRLFAFTRFGYYSPEGLEEVPQAMFWTGDTSVADQAEWTAEAVQLAIENRAVGMIVFNNLDAKGWGSSDFMAGWALIRQDGTCPTCDALSDLLAGQ